MMAAPHFLVCGWLQKDTIRVTEIASETLDWCSEKRKITPEAEYFTVVIVWKPTAGDIRSNRITSTEKVQCVELTRHRHAGSVGAKWAYRD
jgi:hypothetical protein